VTYRRPQRCNRSWKSRGHSYLRNLGTKVSFLHVNQIVETIVSDNIGIRQSQADDQLQKFEIIQKNTEMLQKRVAEVRDRNTQAKKATEDIDNMLVSLESVKSVITDSDLTPEEVIDKFNLNQSPAALK